MAEMPVKFSVIIPAWNAEKYLPRSLDSVLAQTYPALEVLVSDDESTDETRKVTESYGPPVKYMWHEKSGCGGSRNFAIRHSQGDWMALLDADDEWLPNKLEVQARFIEKNPAIKWLGCNFEEVYPDKVWVPEIPRSLLDLIEQDKPIPFFRGSMDLNICPASMVLHKSIFDELGEFDESLPLMEDRDMWWRIAMKYPLFGYPKEICCKYYKAIPGAMTDRDKSRNIEMMILCKHMRRAMELGPAVEADYRPMGRMFAHDFLLRESGGQAEIRPELVAEARELFPLSARQKLCFAMLRMTPEPLRRKLTNRFRR